MKTFFVDSFFKIIPDPRPLKLGDRMNDPYEDCEYLVMHEKCPRDADSDILGITNCPVLVGDSPCSEAKKCIVHCCEISPRKVDGRKQSTLDRMFECRETDLSRKTIIWREDHEGTPKE